MTEFYVFPALWWFLVFGARDACRQRVLSRGGGSMNSSPNMRRDIYAPCRLGLFVVAALLAAAPAARANELGGNVGWQFPDAAQLAANVAAADMINKYQGGYYKPANFTYNTYNNTSAGNSTNCNLYASTVGNAGTTGATATTSSPVVTAYPTNLATSTGNAAQGGYVPLNSTQGNSGSSVGSTVSGSNTSANVGTLNAGYGQTSQVLNSTQGNSGSSMVASINGSSACSGAGAATNGGTVGTSAATVARGK